jgi:hypothetical protein
MRSSILLILLTLIATNGYTLDSSTDSSSLFPNITNWKRGEIKTYTPENLYSPIDGAADLFLRYNFEEMTATEYTCDSNYISVEVYMHKTPIDAFGVYSQERPEYNIYFNIGVQGYKESDYLNFLAGRHYVKVRANKENEKSLAAMNEIATYMAKNLNINASFPVIFNAFPTEGRIPFSEKYISKDVLGYRFLHTSFQVGYNTNGNVYKIFVLAGSDEQDAAKMLNDYFTFLKQPAGDTTEGLYQVFDKYNGALVILKSGKYLLCTQGNISMEESIRLLNDMKTKISN